MSVLRDLSQFFFPLLPLEEGITKNMPKAVETRSWIEQILLLTLHAAGLTGEACVRSPIVRKENRKSHTGRLYMGSRISHPSERVQVTKQTHS